MACILSANQALSRPTIDKMTICYGVDKQDNMSFKTPCMASSGGGAGLGFITYRINGKDYDIESSNDGELLNGKPYKSYLRDAFFNRVRSDSESYSYYCYKAKSAHFCSQQNAN